MKAPEGHSYKNWDLSVYFLKDKRQVKAVNARVRGDRFYILLVKKGVVCICSGTKTVSLEAGTLVVIPINAFWRITEPRGVFQLALISIPATFGFQNYWRENPPVFLTFLMAFPLSKLSLKPKEQSFLLLLFKLLKAKNNEKKKSQVFHEPVTVMVMVYLLQLELSALYHKYVPPSHHLRSMWRYPLLADFLQLLARHCLSEHRIRFYAERLQVHTDYLSKTVKKITGKSAKYFIKQAVVKQAMILLQGNLNIATISRMTGFSNPPSFSRFFKKHTAMSPGEFRKKLNSKGML